MIGKRYERGRCFVLWVAIGLFSVPMRIPTNVLDYKFDKLPAWVRIKVTRDGLALWITLGPCLFQRHARNVSRAHANQRKADTTITDPSPISHQNIREWASFVTALFWSWLTSLDQRFWSEAGRSPGRQPAQHLCQWDFCWFSYYAQ